MNVIHSAAKVFEDRLVNRGVQSEFPDFESVYHMVIEAVDRYNDLWEEASHRKLHQNQLEQEKKDREKMEKAKREKSNHRFVPQSEKDGGAGVGISSGDAAIAPTSVNAADGVDKRRMMFMTEVSIDLYYGCQ